ncbi:MAG: hypothetical protein GF350_16820 [Chitinivibrionales bacterium]|nr:hypothetical protein [Chitinivibrionales bacterium]
MALQKVSLTFAERCCLAQALERQSGTLENARHIKEIRRRFELRSATRDLDLVNLGLGRFSRRADWDEINEGFAPISEWVDRERDKIRDEDKSTKVIAVLDDLSDQIERVDLNARTFTIDSAYIRWIREVAFDDLDWSLVKEKTEMGIREVQLPVEGALMETYASLDEALASAEPVRDD